MLARGVHRQRLPAQRVVIEFDLRGSASNRSAIGAQVELDWNGEKQVQTVSGGCGFSAQNDRRLHFGLGKDPQLDKAVIRWPSGKVQTVDSLVPDKFYTIEESR